MAAAAGPWMSPMNSLMQFLWKYGGRKVCCATIQRGGKTTKSTRAVPCSSSGQVSTV